MIITGVPIIIDRLESLFHMINRLRSLSRMIERHMRR